MGWFSVSLLSLGLAVWLHNLVSLLDNRRRTCRLEPRPWEDSEAPRVSIVLPVRNEGHQVETCVRSLLGQHYPNYELIVVDDRSEDDTAEQLAQFDDAHLRVVQGSELPEGWMGKTWALHQGVRQATGEWLLFTDADTWHHPEALSTALRAALDRRVPFLTMIPFLVCQSFWERVVQPVILFTTFCYMPLRVLENPRRRTALAYGVFVLVRRDACERLGGLSVIRQSVLDDVSLARHFKAHGERIGYVLGPALLRVRMYTSLGEIWNGWGKNFFGGAGGKFSLSILALVLWFVASVLPWLALPALLFKLSLGRDLPTLVGLGLAATIVTLTTTLQRIAMQPYAGLGLRWALLHPLAILVLNAIMVNSMLRVLTGKGPRWKGRVYPGMNT